MGLSSGASKNVEYGLQSAPRREKKPAPAAEFDLLGVSGGAKQPKQKKDEGASFWGGFEPQQKAKAPGTQGGGDWFGAKDAQGFDFGGPPSKGGGDGWGTGGFEFPGTESGERKTSVKEQDF